MSDLGMKSSPKTGLLIPRDNHCTNDHRSNGIYIWIQQRKFLILEAVLHPQLDPKAHFWDLQTKIQIPARMQSRRLPSEDVSVSSEEVRPLRP